MSHFQLSNDLFFSTFKFTSRTENPAHSTRDSFPVGCYHHCGCRSVLRPLFCVQPLRSPGRHGVSGSPTSAPSLRVVARQERPRLFQAQRPGFPFAMWYVVMDVCSLFGIGPCWISPAGPLDPSFDGLKNHIASPVSVLRVSIGAPG